MQGSCGTNLRIVNCNFMTQVISIVLALFAFLLEGFCSSSNRSSNNGDFSRRASAITSLDKALVIPVLLSDATALTHVEVCLKGLYNMDFEQADDSRKKLIGPYESHPVSSLLDALRVYWALYPLKQKPKARTTYLAHLKSCSQKAADIQKIRPTDPEGIFFKAMSQMMIANLESELGNNFSAISSGKSAYNEIKAMNSKPDIHTEYSLAVGLYNYFRVWQEENNPSLKPFLMFFMEGNKEKGLQQIQYAVSNSRFSVGDALHFLVKINLQQENKPIEAASFAKRLIELYPNNWIFQQTVTESYIKAGHYGAAANMLTSISASSSPFKGLTIPLYRAMLIEFGDKKPVIANESYQNCLNYLEKYPNFPNGLKCLVWSGLARTDKDRLQKKLFYEKVAKLAKPGYLKTEAEKWLEQQ